MIAQEDVILIDVRNDYEVALGSFAGAINPATATFGDFPGWLRANRDALTRTGAPSRIAMFCTGGIRCEKATALAAAQGFGEIYHLQGGILNYLDRVPADRACGRANASCSINGGRWAIGRRPRRRARRTSG